MHKNKKQKTLTNCLFDCVFTAYATVTTVLYGDLEAVDSEFLSKTADSQDHVFVYHRQINPRHR